ncbi:Golgi phosphoprotein 3-domain-containing protein [Mycena sanguinolenta]|nr:Golgi phosphoprotein 3-domain-containing protein [Mycena sanguinolenta]
MRVRLTRTPARPSHGSRIAFGPRDLALSSSEDALVGGKLPKLTLMEEVLLLGIKVWNDNISYALRGCILIELASRRRIGIVRDPGRKRLPLLDRPITVLSTRQTGETLLDETLKMMKQTEDGSEKMGVGKWVVLLSAAQSRRRLHTRHRIAGRVRVLCASPSPSGPMHSLGEGDGLEDGDGVTRRVTPCRVALPPERH